MLYVIEKMKPQMLRPSLTVTQIFIGIYSKYADDWSFENSFQNY